MNDTSTTRLRRIIRAPRSAVYHALTDPRAVQRWMVPDGMSSEVHHFEPSEGGTFRISLTYDQPTGPGKTTSHTDTYRGRFLELVRYERLGQVSEFESADPKCRER